MKKKNQPTTPTTHKNPRKTGIQWKPWMEVLLFVVFAGWILVGMNSDYLFTVQENSLFLASDVFWKEMMATPHGFICWIGSYLTQFFYYPAMGSCMLILIWLGIYAVTRKVFNLKKEWSYLALIPPAAMLCSIIGVGYWIYYLKIPGYWFGESVALLLTLLGTWGAQTTKGWGKSIYIGVWTALGYPILGWYALLGAALMGINHLQEENKGGSRYIPLATAAILIAVCPLLWYYHYHQIRLEDAWIYGFPLFATKDSISWIMEKPFLLMTLTCLALAASSKRLQTATNSQSRYLHAGCRTIVLAGCALLIWTTNFDDYNYHAEMRMYRHTESCNWKGVLEEAKQCPNAPTRQMVLMKNIALMNTGQLGNRMYHYDNGGMLPHKRDNLVIHLVNTAGPLLYYHYGKLNFATRWAIENGVEHGFDISILKILARSALLSGEIESAKKYVELLSLTTFHKDEAEELRLLCQNPKLIKDKEEFKTIRELHAHITDDLDSDNGLCEMYLLHNFSNTMNIDSHLLQEVTLNYAMVSKNIQLFWPRFFQYATLHQGEAMPLHYQEAAYLYGNLERPPFDISKMPFDKQQIKNRYIQFNSIIQHNLKKGLKEQEIAEILKPTFGDTFWWFYFFCNNVSSY